ncbi:MAG: hypothetical protein HQL20_05300 [Candidatus Omnitrophica bacterium]|nr:hypothetical protein [Candidatus Omnitrophota bacterium]
MSTETDMAAELAAAQAGLKAAEERMGALENAALLGDMFSGIAHELNQPLNVTKIICQGLVRDAQKGRFSVEEAKTDLPEIITQMNKLSELITHMRALAVAKVGVPPEKQNLNEIIQYALQFVGTQYKSHKIEVVLSLQESLPYVMGEAIRLEQTVLNLMNQARKEVELVEGTGRQVMLKTSVAADGQVVLEVGNNAAGAALEPRLTGCKKTVTDFGGQLEFTRSPGGASAFKVTFPAA